jgi:hypothetical protein
VINWPDQDLTTPFDDFERTLEELGVTSVEYRRKGGVWTVKLAGEIQYSGESGCGDLLVVPGTDARGVGRHERLSYAVAEALAGLRYWKAGGQ